jgi:hypothetical protein
MKPPPEDAVQLMNHEFWRTAPAPMMRAQPPRESSVSGAEWRALGAARRGGVDGREERGSAAKLNAIDDDAVTW